MATIRFPEDVWKKSQDWLLGRGGEHFAFFLAKWTYSCGEPVFWVRDVMLIPDTQTSNERDGVSLSLGQILGVINAAIKSGDCLIEAHNHGGESPRFSFTDRRGFQEFVPYVQESLPGRPYGATVWGDTSVYGEFFDQGGRQGVINSITVIGEHLKQVASRDDDKSRIDEIFDRQMPWFTQEGQRQIGRIRAGIVGCGGTGSHVIQNLTFLGCRDFVLIDDDLVEDTNMNRLVTATPADVGTPKVFVGRRFIKTVAPDARVLAVNKPLQSSDATDALKGVDVIFGCLDNDSARLILNELALAYVIPYIDLAVGIEADKGSVTSAGGRVAIVMSGGPCLNCMGEIDPEEAGYFLATPEERSLQVTRGYVSGMNVKAPAVVSLNGIIATAAVNEFAVLTSGIRLVNIYTEYDLLGTGRTMKGQWLSPHRIKGKVSCVQCAVAGSGDLAGLERYIREG